MIAAVVPAKALGRAKGRLAEVLSKTERQELSLAMLEDVLGSLAETPGLARICVVSPDRMILAVARKHGADALPEPEGTPGLNAALKLADDSLPAHRALLVALADVPQAEPGDYEALLEALPARGVAASRAEDGGTPALAMQPPQVIPFRFGIGSYEAHRREAAAAGVEFVTVARKNLQSDVDTPEDLRDVLLSGRPSKTRDFLLMIKMPRRLNVPETAA